MVKQTKAAVLKEIGKIEFEIRDIPELKENEVMVKIKHVGICGSDLHYYEYGRIGDFVVEKPIILGHESSGEIIETESRVINVIPGDKVALEPGYSCGKCEFCKTGRYNLCSGLVFMATPPYDGAFTEYVVYPSDMVFKLPENMTTLEGALIEPLAVGLHAANQANAKIGQSAVILGSGCIGLVTLLSLRAIGVTEIYISDLIPTRLEKAMELGAKKAFKADEVDIYKEIMEITKGEGVDMVFETAGSQIATKKTVELVKRGGHIVLVGMAPDAVIPYDFGLLISKEAAIHTVFRYRNLYPSAIKAVSAGLIPIKKIVTNTFRFEDVDKALEFSLKNKNDIVKGIVEF